MPHLDYDDLRLDHLYPSIVAPEDDRLDDLANDDCDQTYQAGLRAADEIRRSMRVAGRRRRIAEAAPPAAKPAPRRQKNEQSKDGASKVDTNGASSNSLNGLDDNYCSDKLTFFNLLQNTSAAPSSPLCRRRSVKGSGPWSHPEAVDSFHSRSSIERSRSCSPIATYLAELMLIPLRKLKFPDHIRST